MQISSHTKNLVNIVIDYADVFEERNEKLNVKGSIVQRKPVQFTVVVQSMQFGIG